MHSVQELIEETVQKTLISDPEDPRVGSTTIPFSLGVLKLAGSNGQPVTSPTRGSIKTYIRVSRRI